jgi:mannose-6-phosphate isomerase class I
MLGKLNLKSVITGELKKSNGILRLEPAWVARDFLPPGKRLGLPEDQYNLGERGGICERWIGSTTKADNKVGVPNEGLSYLNLDLEQKITLKEAVELLPEEIMGKDYASTHRGLGRLPKIFDYEFRLPFHIHQMQKHAQLLGRNSKEEAYYFPQGLSMGKEPDTFFGVHPYISREKKYDLLLPAMVEWKNDSILQFARAYKLMPDDGWHIPSGVTHAPGSALTIELQEDSDVFAMMQAKTGGKIIDKELLYKDVRKIDREKYGEKIILEMIDWETSGDPYFYENRHTPPVLIDGTKSKDGEEYWIFYNTNKFSGKKLIVHPKGKFVSKDKGLYNILVWKGKGIFGGIEIEAGNHNKEELLICYDAAINSLTVENTGSDDLVIFKFFGPDINTDVPMLKRYN